MTHAVYIHLNVKYFASKSFEAPKVYVVDMFLISEFHSLTKALFIVQVVLIAIAITLPGYKGTSLELAPVPSHQYSFEAEIVPLLSFCDETGTVTLLFY